MSVLWSLLLELASTGAARASTIDVSVPDPKVLRVILTCSDGTYEATPKNGSVTFEHVPKNCQVSMVRKSGLIDSTGTWTCTADACTKEQVEHRPVTDAPNRVNVIVTTPLPPGAALELTCSNGFRVRSEVVTNTASFDSVPNEECTLFFKGTVPAKYRPMSPGTWWCSLSGVTAICKLQ